MLHRALYGSLERFLGILLEHHGAALPAWLAREAAQEAVMLRTRAGQRVCQQPAAVDELRALCRPPDFAA